MNEDHFRSKKVQAMVLSFSTFSIKLFYILKTNFSNDVPDKKIQMDIVYEITKSEFCFLCYVSHLTYYIISNSVS